VRGLRELEVIFRTFLIVPRAFARANLPWQDHLGPVVFMGPQPRRRVIAPPPDQLHRGQSMGFRSARLACDRPSAGYHCQPVLALTALARRLHCRIDLPLTGQSNPQEGLPRCRPAHPTVSITLTGSIGLSRGIIVVGFAVGQLGRSCATSPGTPRAWHWPMIRRSCERWKPPCVSPIGSCRVKHRSSWLVRQFSRCWECAPRGPKRPWRRGAWAILACMAPADTWRHRCLDR